MGYETRYKLEIDGLGKDASEVLDYLESHEYGYYGNFIWIYKQWSESIKCYDHETDMAVLSKYFPDLIFILEGHGEDFGDYWKKYFKQTYIGDPLV